MKRQDTILWYVGLLTAGMLVILAYCGVSIWRHPPGGYGMLVQVLILIGLGWFASSQRVYVSESNEVLMGTVAQIATMVVLPLPLAIVTVGAAKALNQTVQTVKRRRKLRFPLVNVSGSVMATAVAAAAFKLLHGTHFLFAPGALSPLEAFPALAMMALTYYAVDALVVAGAIRLSSQERITAVLTQITQGTFLPELSLIVVGIVFAILWHFSPVLSLFIIVPIFLSVRSYEALANLRTETEKAVTHLAKSVDMRDTGTGIHSQQLEKSAERLARAIGLTPEHAREVGLAARAHDLGKIEISDAILLKRGPLTPEERLEMEKHPVIGADMLEAYSSFAKSVGFVRHHHERWDGKGYPDGLKGEEIPIGARIISVVDAFDAMTADRPYRKALSISEAVNRLKKDIGAQFDPRICAVWIQLLIEDGAFVPEPTAPHLHVVREDAEAG